MSTARSKFSSKLAIFHLRAGATSAQTFFASPLLAGKMSADYIEAVPTIDIPDDELAAVTAAICGVIEDDKFPHAPRLDPLRAALAGLDAASKPVLEPEASPAAKADKRARR